MAYFYDKSTNGFYNDAVHSNIPNTAKEITIDFYNELLSGQSVGKVIAADINDLPCLIEPVPTEEELKAARVAELKRLLSDSDFRVLPDYQSRSGKTDAEISTYISERKAWYDELQGLM